MNFTQARDPLMRHGFCDSHFLLFRNSLTYDHGIGEQDGVWNNDPLAFGTGNDSSARLNIFDLSLQAGYVNPIADPERFNLDTTCLRPAPKGQSIS